MTTARTARRSNRVAFWLSGLIAVELAIAAASVTYQAVATEDPRNIAPMWGAIAALAVMGIHAGFWTTVRALRSQPMRPLRAWLAFIVLMICCGWTALSGALAIVTLRYPIG
ncbi:hypothetical protein [Mycolicibacterium fortuitum]|uniref:hypothetical protein n=1 Tax=Mycolicibacterium fortuitum TaxID=1766 RepID=UPI002621DF6D|nr:hypothetical protein [Mycolicibacterium fortuitum]